MFGCRFGKRGVRFAAQLRFGVDFSRFFGVIAGALPRFYLFPDWLRTISYTAP